MLGPCLLSSAAAQCPGCQPKTISLDKHTEPSGHASATAVGVTSQITVIVDSVKAGVCGPDIGSSCSKQLQQAELTATVSAFSGPLEFCVVQISHIGTIICPAGQFDSIFRLLTDCKLSGDRVRVIVFSAATLEPIDYTGCNYWATKCPLPD